MRRKEIETMTLGGPIYQAWIREYQEREYKKTLPHFVYFASNGNGYLKIGLTSNLKNRLRQLKHANPSTFYIDFIKVENKNEAQYVESVLHSIFNETKIAGEWFDEIKTYGIMEEKGFSIKQLKEDYQRFFNEFPLIETDARNYYLGEQSNVQTM